MFSIADGRGSKMIQRERDDGLNGDSMTREKRRWRTLELALAFCLAVAWLGPAIAQTASPADLISNYRVKNGEGRVTADPVLNRIAQQQANAMAARDLLDHAALAPLSSRVAEVPSGGARRIAENLAGAYADFPRTLDQWIESPGHRSNLLMHDGLRVGVASAKSPKTGRTYWAMEIAGDIAGAAVGTARAIATAPFRAPDNCPPGTFFTGPDGQQHPCR
jgi:Cysteine-rich secretory protein family